MHRMINLPLKIEKKIEVIKKSEFFRCSSEKLLNELAGLTTELHCMPMEIIVREGDLGSSMYFVVQGHLKVHKGDKIKAELQAFDMFGEFAMLSSEVRLASVSAMEDCILLELTREDIYGLMSRNQELYKKIIEILCRRVREMIELEKKLNQHEKLASLGLLTSGIAHELKNPINFIVNFSSLICESIKELIDAVEKNETGLSIKNDLNEISGVINKIHNHSLRADSIVNGLLSHVHLRSSQFEKTSITHLIKEALQLSLQSFKLKWDDFDVNIHEDYSCNIDLNVVTSDLIRVFINILDNAFYAMHEQKKVNPNFTPKLEVSCQGLPEYVAISFKDNGGGISQTHIDQIFHPFFTTKPTGIGTGLGLSLSYDIITKQHKGKIMVRSDHHEYTEFVIMLPIV